MKMNTKIKEFFQGAATFLGTIVGAGIFGIPYVFSKSGVLVSGLYFIFVFFIVLSLNLFFSEIILRTKERHRLVGYAGYYLGKKAKAIETISIAIGACGSLLAYIILSGEFLHMFIPSVPKFTLGAVSWVVISFLIYLGIRSIAITELLMNTLLFLAFFVIVGDCLFHFTHQNLVFWDKNFIFLPFGIFLYSLVGWNAIPELEPLLSQKKQLKKIIISVLVFVVAFYFVFGLAVSGVSGQETTQQPFEGLVKFLGEEILVFAGVFGLMAVLTSFLVLGNYLKNTLLFDYQISYPIAFFVSVLPPFLLYFLGIRKFIPVIGVVGSVVGIIDGAMIILTFLKAKKHGDRVPEYSVDIPRVFLYLIIFILVLGGAGEFLFLLRK